MRSRGHCMDWTAFKTCRERDSSFAVQFPNFCGEFSSRARDFSIDSVYLEDGMYGSLTGGRSSRWRMQTGSTEIPLVSRRVRDFFVWFRWFATSNLECFWIVCPRSAGGLPLSHPIATSVAFLVFIVTPFHTLLSTYLWCGMTFNCCYTAPLSRCAFPFCLRLLLLGTHWHHVWWIFINVLIGRHDCYRSDSLLVRRYSENTIGFSTIARAATWCKSVMKMAPIGHAGNGASLSLT
jgi:hypothetical protein